jgi:hypothetical protein
MLKIANLFEFCYLKKLVRPETFGPYHVLYGLLCKIAYLFKSFLQNGLLKENTNLKFGTLEQRFQFCSASTKIKFKSKFRELQVSFE